MCDDQGTQGVQFVKSPIILKREKWKWHANISTKPWIY